MALLSDAGIAGGLIFLACLLSFACLLVLAFQDGRQQPEVGDDAIALIKQAREQDAAEAQADHEREIRNMIRRYGG